MNHRVNIKGAIISNNDEWIYEMFDMEATSPRMVSEALTEANGEDVEVIINSGGGSLFEASEIYTELREYQGHVEVKVVGVAASAASIIMMAGDHVRISPTAQIMIHNGRVVEMGDRHTMKKTSETLENIDKTIASAYKLKTGMEDDELMKMMDEETWINPEMAKEYGFVDEIMFSNDQVKVVASIADGYIPEKVIEGIRNGMMKPDSLTKDDVKNMLMEFKDEIKNEIKPEEPEPKPKGNIGRLFINL